MSLAMAAPAFAGAQIYGSMRYDTFYLTQKTFGETNNAGKDNATVLQNELAGNSRVGVKWDEGKLFGHFEAGIKGSSGDNGIYTRLMYGTYTFNGGNVLIGQTYDPWTMFSDQAYGGDNGFIGYGALYDSRQPQIKLTFSGFYIALVHSHTAAVLNTGDVQQVEIPKVGIGYDGKMGNFSFGAGFAYQTYKEKNAAIGFDKNINSYLGYGRVAVDIAPVTVKAQVHYGQNLANFGISGRTAGAATLNSNGGVHNTDCYGGFVQVGAKVAPVASINAGVGYTSDKMAGTKYNQTSVFVNAPIEIAKGFHVVPEFDYFHYNHAHAGGQVSIADLPNMKNGYVFGAKWQMDF
jgi:hypothetical protein